MTIAAVNATLSKADASGMLETFWQVHEQKILQLFQMEL